MADPLTAAAIAQLLDGVSDVTALVVGDLMLDDYLAGEAPRISPEAPVPIVLAQRSFHRAGGAANVACGLAALGARVELAGVIGDDAAGATLLATLAAANVDTRLVARDAERPTTRKLRILAGHHQQLLRIDWERTAPVPPALAAPILGRLDDPAPLAVVMLSDYAKGMLTPELVAAAVAAARRRGIPIVVDPKSSDFRRYRGATVITPNLAEVERAVGRALGDLAAVESAARELAGHAEADALVVTLGERGMLVVPRAGAAEHVPALRRDVYDVTGAGDTAAAAYALALAVGADHAMAAHLATLAAGIVVDKVGTATVRRGELAAAALARAGDKVVSPAILPELLAWWRSEGKRVVFTNGCFDLLHVGHVALLREAARLGDVLVVGLNSDASVARLKGPTRPLLPEVERAAVLGALGCVDAVVVFDEDTPLRLIEAVRPDVLAKGADYRVEQVVGRELVEAAGGRVALIPLVEDRSTTALVERIARRGSR